MKIKITDGMFFNNLQHYIFEYIENNVLVTGTATPVDNSKHRIDFDISIDDVKSLDGDEEYANALVYLNEYAIKRDIETAILKRIVEKMDENKKNKRRDYYENR